MATKQQVRDAIIRSNGCRTTLGVSVFVCGLCLRRLGHADYDGGVWIGGSGPNEASGVHVHVCRQCSEDPWWMDRTEQ